MKSVKPGRGPSFMGGIASIAVGVVGVIWTLSAVDMGAPGLFAACGIVFVLLAVGGGIYNLVNATSKKRFSSFDITDNDEEPDPLNERFGAQAEVMFCPYCGQKVDRAHVFCAHCGKQLQRERDQ